MADANCVEEWNYKARQDEEMEFFTELALHETERWIQAVTKKMFQYPDDPRKSLENGILLCELLNSIKPGSVKRINKLPTPIAGLDNLNVFLNSCRSHFGLTDAHLFDPADLEDLSQRAIADSEHLKQEIERRLRNVAITVYYIGKSVKSFYTGPQLDFSAFAPLVHLHSKDIISDEHILRNSTSWESSDVQAVYGSSQGGVRDRDLREPLPRSQWDSSYESYASFEKGSQDSLDEQEDLDNMPGVRRYGSASALNKNGGDSYNYGHHGRDYDSLYPDDRNDSMYRSSPDLSSQGSYHHHRSSSTDSLDGSYTGGHSRQSSGSTDGYPTRNIQARRTSSSATDPLQFVKAKTALELAKQAEEQMKLATEVKKLDRPVFNDEDDWLSNLSTWKTRRKSQSSFHVLDEYKAEEEELEQKKLEQAKHQTKTFSQMKEERERRKSIGRNIYPFEEEEEEEVIPVKSTQQENSSQPNTSSTSSDVLTPVIHSDNYVPDWAKSEDDDENGTKTNQSAAEDKNNNQSNKGKDSEDADSVFTNNKDSNFSGKRRTGMVDTPTHRERQKLYESERGNRVSQLNRDNSSRSNKINDIRNRFEQKEEETKPRTPVLGAKVDVKARKKSFEKPDNNSVNNVAHHERRYDQNSIRDSKLEKDYLRGSGIHSDSMQTRSYVQSKKNDDNDDDGGDKWKRNYSQTKRGDEDRWNSTNSSVDTSWTKGVTTARSEEDDFRTASSNKRFTEKTIKISQKPNSARGFGFTVQGGIDVRQPITVERVSLGSAADINELQTKDEIVIINKKDVTSLTNEEVNLLIADAVQSGYLELRVKRCLSDQDDEDEFLSSDEEIETLDSNQNQQTESDLANVSYESQRSRASQEDFRHSANKNPVASALDDDQPWGTSESQHTGDERDSGMGHSINMYNSYEEPSTDASDQTAADSSSFNGQQQENDQERTLSSFSDQQHEQERAVFQQQDIEVEVRPTLSVTRRREHHVTASPEDDDTKPLSPSKSPEAPVNDEVHVEVKMRHKHQKAEDDDVDTDDSNGPPAILRKWQKQRPKSEYTFEEKPVMQKRLSSTLPWLSSSAEISDRDHSKDDLFVKKSQQKEPPMPFPRRQRTFDQSEDARLKEWEIKQEQKRQQPESADNAVEIQFPFNKEQFKEDQEKMRRQYEEDQKRAEELARKKSEQEQKRLEPEMQRMKEMEERRQERRNRLNELHVQAYNDDDLTRNRNRHDRTGTRSDASNRTEKQEHIQSSSLTFQLESKQQQPLQQQQWSQQQQQLSPHQQQQQWSPQQRQPQQQPQAVLVIDPRNRADDEQDQAEYNFRININKREMSDSPYVHPEIHTDLRSPPESQQKGSQDLLLEEERERQWQEELRKKEEERRLQEKAEQLRIQEEKLRQEREQLRLEQEKIQREQQELQQQKEMLQKSAKLADTKKSEPVWFEPPAQSRIREPSPTYNSTLHTHKRPEVIRVSSQPEPGLAFGRPQYSTTLVVEPKSSSRRLEQTWTPPSPSFDSADSKDVPGRLTREDMLAMNRKPTPLQTRPELSPPLSPDSGGANPIKRGTPSRQQLHSLNAVPKPKIRSSSEWMANTSEMYKPQEPGPGPGPGLGPGPGPGPGLGPGPSRHADIMKKQYSTPQEHWLYEEAERRRLASMEPRSKAAHPAPHSQFSGPIKPASDNKWRDGRTYEQTFSPPNTSFERGARPESSMPAQIRHTLLQKTAGARGSTGSNYSQDLGSYPLYPVEQPTSLSQMMSSSSSSSYNYNNSTAPASRQEPPSVRAPPPPESSTEQVMPVSGKQQCSHCNQELGFGAAMIIESLGLYYHVQCFRCCVCHAPLGSGSEGADVRVRVNKLHCPNCYSNDEAGLKFSKV